jgi:hypothetical protein
VRAVCGIVAAVVIIQPRLDVVPDALEALGVAVVVVLVSLGLIMLTWRRGLRDWARRSRASGGIATRVLHAGAQPDMARLPTRMPPRAHEAA